MARRERKRRRKYLMPGERELELTELDELWDARGGFLYARMTDGVKRWMDLLEAPGVPHCGEDAVVFLSGVRNDGKEAFGMCDSVIHKGRKMGVVLLDDLDPREMKRINGVISRHVPKTYSPRFLKEVWDAYLVQTYLHELGHWQHLKAGRRLSEAREEQEAERFAWKWMEKIFKKKEVIAGVMGLHWVLLVA